MTASPPYVLVLVPSEPTKEMLWARLPGDQFNPPRLESRRDLRPAIYTAMLSARPESSSKLQQAQEEVIRCTRELKFGIHPIEDGFVIYVTDGSPKKLLDALASLSAAEGNKT